jgi:curved DNA-binding protein
MPRPRKSQPTLSLADARAVLGLTVLAGPAEIRRAFRDAAKRAHPDRPGGDAARFRLVLDAYHRLTGEGLAIPGPAMAAEAPLAISPAQALLGGDCDTPLADGRTLRIRLPAGLRDGERLRAGQALFRIAVLAEGDTLVRGDDLWLSAKVAPHILAEGGRVAVETPLGRRIVWVTRKAGERGLIRLEGQGLPARGGRPQGALFLRLAADAPPESQARQRLKRFAAAWAA